jgi:hypothetical protein
MYYEGEFGDPNVKTSIDMGGTIVEWSKVGQSKQKSNKIRSNIPNF